MPTAGSWRGSSASKCLVACAAILLLAACSDGGTGPSVPVEGSYTLTSYDSRALPVVLRVIADNPTTPGGESIRCEDRLTGMVLDLNGGGHFTSTSARQLVCDNGDPHAVTHESESGSYEVTGTAVTLTFDEVDSQVTVATGTLDAHGLTITKRVTAGPYGSVTDPTPMEFGRIVAL